MSADLQSTITRALEDELKGKLDTLITDAIRQASEQLQGQCAEAVETAVREAGAQAAGESVKAVAEALHESVRRIRQEDSVTGIASALVDGAAGFCGRAALLIHKGDQLLGFRMAGAADDEVSSKLARLSFPAEDASGFAHALSSLDSTVTRGTASDLSPGMVELLELNEEDSVALFPIVLRDRALAVLYCDGRDDKPVDTPAVEILVSMAEAWIEAVGTRRKQTSTAA